MTIFEWFEKVKNIVRTDLKNLSIRKIYIAVSGGRDSIFLLTVLSEIFDKEKLCVLHMDHSLRGEQSNLDREFVQKYAQDLGIKVCATKISISPISGDGGLENLARQKRYEWFRSIITSQEDVLCCGHTMDDHLETILMKVYRGTGITGLKGIEFEHKLFDLRVVRPLLLVQRQCITKLLCVRKIPWREDESNATEQYFRNFIRQKIISSFAESLLKRILYLSILSKALKNQFAVPSAVKMGDGVEVGLKEIGQLSNFEIRNFIEKVYLYLRNNTGPSKKHFVLFLQFLKNDAFHLQLPGHIDIYKAQKRVFFKYKLFKNCVRFQLVNNPEAFCEEEILCFPKSEKNQLIIRVVDLKKDQWNHKKISKIKRVINLPKWRRESIVVVEYQEEIIFSHYLGYSDRLREILLVEIEKETIFIPKCMGLL